MPIRDLFSPRIEAPPAVEDSQLALYLDNIADKLNELPRFSVFSFATPESNVTAQAGTLGFNEASSTTKLWLKQTGSGDTGWVSLSTE